MPKQNKEVSIGLELDWTIKNLEALRDMVDPPVEALNEILDELYQLRIDLIEAAIKRDTEKYKKAATAMKKAAKETKESIDDLAKLEKAIEKVAKSIGKAGDLLGKIT